MGLPGGVAQAELGSPGGSGTRGRVRVVCFGAPGRLLEPSVVALEALRVAGGRPSRGPRCPRRGRWAPDPASPEGFFRRKRSRSHLPGPSYLGPARTPSLAGRPCHAALRSPPPGPAPGQRRQRVLLSGQLSRSADPVDVLGSGDPRTERVSRRDGTAGRAAQAALPAFFCPRVWGQGASIRGREGARLLAPNPALRAGEPWRCARGLHIPNSSPS